MLLCRTFAPCHRTRQSFGTHRWWTGPAEGASCVDCDGCIAAEWQVLCKFPEALLEVFDLAGRPNTGAAVISLVERLPLLLQNVHGPFLLAEFAENRPHAHKRGGGPPGCEGRHGRYEV